MDGENKIALVSVSIGVVIFLLMVIDLGFCMPHAEQDAIRQCVDAGYGLTVVSYQRTPFSQTALGVKCIEPAKVYIVEGNGTLIINNNPK